MIKPTCSLQPQWALPEVLINTDKIMINIKGIPAPPAGMHIANHRHAEKLVTEEDLSAVAGEGLHHGINLWVSTK
jgi:hypothetical protein